MSSDPVPKDSLAAAQQLSVIIPALNEAERIGETLQAVMGRGGDGGEVEVIVADGGSSDQTAAIARQYGAVVIDAETGRGRQMNRGANAAAGEVLLFLHADSLPPPGFACRVRQILADQQVIAGAFCLAIGAEGFTLRLIERVANLRSRFLRMPYGDQGLYLRAAVFRQLGGFPDLPLMEDFELVRRLRRHGRIVIAPEAVTTSPRRWLELGPWRCTLRNWLTVLRYLSGAPPERLAKSYRTRAAAGPHAGTPDRP